MRNRSSSHKGKPKKTEQNAPLSAGDTSSRSSTPRRRETASVKSACVDAPRALPCRPSLRRSVVASPTAAAAATRPHRKTTRDDNDGKVDGDDGCVAAPSALVTRWRCRRPCRRRCRRHRRRPACRA
eukprot:656450-Pleurochrysis_carterae.AAC.1